MNTNIIAIAGASGSGKTTIANEILKPYTSDQCTIISSDNYYKDLSHLSAEERDNINFDHPDSIDFQLLAAHINLLKQGKAVDIPTYDFATHMRQEQTLSIAPKPIIIIEGILILHPTCLKASYDIKLFVNTDQDICFIRRLERDVAERGRTMEQVIAQYQKHVKPMYEQFVAPCKHFANLVINNTTSFDITPLIMHLSNESQPTPHTQLSVFATPQAQADSSTLELEHTYCT